VWLDPKVVEHLRALRGPGESYSDVILRLAGQGIGNPLVGRKPAENFGDSNRLGRAGGS
jgi:hypothetical protein